jgi:hypothetical protein
MKIKIKRDKLVSLFNEQLEKLVSKAEIYNYKVVSDESNNLPNTNGCKFSFYIQKIKSMGTSITTHIFDKDENGYLLLEREGYSGNTLIDKLANNIIADLIYLNRKNEIEKIID